MIEEGRTFYSVFKDFTNYAKDYVSTNVLPRSDSNYMYKAQQFDHFCVFKGLRSGCLDSANLTFRAEALLAIDENISIIILV